MKRHLAAISAFIAVGIPAASAQHPTNFKPAPAVFSIKGEVINEQVGPFTVTAPAFGNTLRRTGRGAFEPASFRQRLLVTQDSPDRIHDSRSEGIGYYDVYASGYLDGADVQVYRIVNGKVKLVREDKVAAGGSVIEAWKGIISDQKVIPADVTQAQFRWEDWSRPGSQRWFTVFAVDLAGGLSAAATPVKLEFTTAKPNTQQKNKDTGFRPQGKSSGPLPAPTDFRASVNADGIVEFSWKPVKSDQVAGYRIARTDTDPAKHRGTYLQLAGKPATADEQLRTGDMVIVSRSLVEFDRSWLSHRLANLGREVEAHIPSGVPGGFHRGETPGKDWQLVCHEANTPVTDPGEYYFEMTLRDGDVELVGKKGSPDISNTEQDYYPVPEDGKEYLMEVWMKADRDDRAPVVFTWDGDEKIGGFVGEHPLQLTTEWKKYEVRFTGRSSEKGHHAFFVLKTQGPGTFSFDNYRIYATDAEFLDYRPHHYAQLKDSGMGFFRTHGPIKTGMQTYSMRQYLGAPGEAEGVALGNTLPQALRMCERAGIAPWLQIEFHMTPSEWLAFAEYMAATYDPASDSPATKPYAALRHSQGRHAPWTDAFPQIYFELANETWNGLFAPWVFDNMPDGADGKMWKRGEVYAMFHDHVADILRSSPHWQPKLEETFVHILGGWATTLNGSSMTSGYTQEIANASRSGEFITIAAYNGGWDEAEGTPKLDPASYFNVLSAVNQTAIPRAIEFRKLQQHHSAQGRDFAIGTYEAGPGYALNGLNNDRVSREEAATQELVMKSKRAGTATLDTFLAQASHNYDTMNFFTFAEGDLWKSHAHARRGGHPHASFLPLQVFNREATGTLLTVETLSVPSVDTVAFKRRQAIPAAPLATVYATRNGDRVNVVCLSRKVAGYPDAGHDGFTPFELRLPFTKAKSITLHRLTGSPEDHNIHSENVKSETLPIDPATLGSDGVFRIQPATGGDKRGLPPSEFFLYVFEGIDGMNPPASSAN